MISQTLYFDNTPLRNTSFYLSRSFSSPSFPLATRDLPQTRSRRNRDEGTDEGATKDYEGKRRSNPWNVAERNATIYVLRASVLSLPGKYLQL